MRAWESKKQFHDGAVAQEADDFGPQLGCYKQYTRVIKIDTEAVLRICHW
jgi:hypothetical protein